MLTSLSHVPQEWRLPVSPLSSDSDRDTLTMVMLKAHLFERAL